MSTTDPRTASQPIIETDLSLPLVHASVALKTGALLDPPGKEGTARLLFRLLRRTCAGRSAEQADDLLDRLGSHLGAEVGRSTAAFHGGAIARSTAPFFEFLFDTVTRPSFRKDEFEQLLVETRAELVEKLDDDRSLARAFWNRRIFAGHPYSRPPGGSLTSLSRITIEDVRALYEALFVRENLEFAFAGQISVSAAQELARRVTEALPAGSAPLADPAHPTGPEGRKLVFIDKPDRTQTQILIGGLGSHPADPDHTALHVGNTIFGGTFTARLSQEVRAKRGWSYGAYSQLPFDRKRQAFSMWTFPQASDAAACIRLELELLERWVQDGVTARELAAAKKYLIRSHAFAIDTAAKRASLALDEVLYDLPPGYQATVLDRIAQVSLDEVNQAIRARISPQNLVLAVLGTHKEIGSAVTESIPNLSSEELVRFDAEE